MIRWLALLIALQTTVGWTHSAAMAMGEPKTLTFREFIALVIRLPTTVLCAWAFGLTGAVIACALAGLVTIGLYIGIAARLLKIPVLRQITGVSHSLFSGAALVALLLTLCMLLAEGDPRPVLLLVLLVPVGALGYLGTHLLLWQISGRPQGAESFLPRVLRRQAPSGQA